MESIAMKKNYLIVLLLIVAIAAISVITSVNAAKAPAKCAAVCSDLCSSECTAGMGYGFGPKALVGVKPNASQVKKLNSIHANFISSTKTARASLQSKMRDLAGLWASGKGSESKVKSLITAIERDRATIRNAAVSSTFKAINVLDSKQKAKLKTTIANGYIHLVSIGTRMNGASGPAVKGKKMSACPTSCKP